MFRVVQTTSILIRRYSQTISYARFSTFREGDTVLLEKVGANQTLILSKPLLAQSSINVHNGYVPHKDIIGRRPRETVTSTHGATYRLRIPTLEQYTQLTPRLVTPIYSKEANIIVSQLDLHTSCTDRSGERLEILEAGTGHGSLTLHLARALHGINNPLTETFRISGSNFVPTGIEDPSSKGISSAQTLSNHELNASLEFEYRSHQGATVHSIDISSANSLHARKTVTRFRRGMYARNVKFHVGDVRSWVIQEQKSRFGVNQSGHTSFLNHIVLDLPEVHQILDVVSTALHEDGRLLVYCPNVTQIVDCVSKIRRENLPLEMDRVLELGPSLSGGREWDVRSFVPRAVARLHDEFSTTDGGGLDTNVNSDGIRSQNADADRSVIVCRPSVGYRVTSGSFLGIWQKMLR